MGMQRDDWDKLWDGLDPQQPGSGRCGCWLASALLLLVLVAACLASAYMVWQRLGLPLQPGILLSPPTAIPAITTESESSSSSTAESPALAPTVTLSAAQAAGDIVAHQITSAPLVDGNLDEWGEGPAYESQFRVYTAEKWDGTDDVRATWRLAWDNENLYIAAQVEDDVHVQTQTGNTIFRGDGLSLQIDSQREADLGPILSPDDFQINLSPGNFAGIAPSAYRFRGNNDGTMPDAPGHSIAVATQQAEQGYILEAAIPWADIALTPSAGLVIGVALNVNDNDTPGTAVQELMKSHVATRAFRDPTSWGTLTLK